MNPHATTPNRKQSVSNNKPNCNVPKDTKSPKDEHVSEPDEKKEVESLETKKDETKVPKRENTPDIVKGAGIQKPIDDMEPQIMVNEEDESSNCKSEEGPKEVEEIVVKPTSEEKSMENEHDKNTNSEMKEDDQPSLEQTPAKHIISSEEEAKAKLAEKRRLMKEKMEREAELERQRLVS